MSVRVSRYQQGSVEVVQLGDRLTIEEADSVRVLVDEAICSSVPQVIIDLRRLRLIDSAGLELLVDCSANCVARGGQLRLCGAGPLILDILRVTGLSRQFAINQDVVAAAGAFAR